MTRHPVVNGQFPEGADVELRLGGRLAPAVRVRVERRMESVPRAFTAGGVPVHGAMFKAAGDVTVEMLLDDAREAGLESVTTCQLLLRPYGGAPDHLTDEMELRLKASSLEVEAGEPLTVKAVFDIKREGRLLCDCLDCLAREVMES